MGVWVFYYHYKKEKKMIGEKFHCLKCEYEWHSRTEHSPKFCPKCKNPKWWKKKVRNIKEQKDA